MAINVSVYNGGLVPDIVLLISTTINYPIRKGGGIASSLFIYFLPVLVFLFSIFCL